MDCSLKIVTVCLSQVLVSLVFGQANQSTNPYAKNAEVLELAKPVRLIVSPSRINVLVPNTGRMDPNLEVVFKNYMILWATAETEEPKWVEWNLQSPAAGTYAVTAVLDGEGTHLSLNCNGESLEATFQGLDWDRIDLGRVRLNAGDNTLRLKIKPGGAFRFSGLELTQPVVKERIRKETIARRKSPEWFKDAGYGLMFQWTNRAAPPLGPIKDWKQKVDDFDIDAFVEMVDSTGAAYVVWSITWGQQYLSAPIASLDRLISDRTTKRDLLGEMADRLHERDIKLIFYYHYGYECYHSRDMEWLEAVGGLKPDKTDLYENLMGIIAEIGERYGDKLHGWWFDGGARYYNCHFDGSSGAEGILTAPFSEFSQAARMGNDQRILAYNSWIKPRVTEYQDYYGGEGRKSFDPTSLEEGTFDSGRQEGLQAHGCFILEKRWGHIEMNTTIPKPKYTVEQLTGFVQQAQANRYPLSINLEMYEDGSVSPESLSALRELKSSVRERLLYGKD